MRWFDAASFETPDAIQCLKCGDAYLPLGPSDEHASEAVEIEIRAAEIATLDEDEPGMTSSEVAGWSRGESPLIKWVVMDGRAPKAREYQSGYLARCIVEHDGGDA